MQAGLDIMCITISHPCDYHFPASLSDSQRKKLRVDGLWLEMDGHNGFYSLFAYIQIGSLPTFATLDQEYQSALSLPIRFSQNC